MTGFKLSSNMATARNFLQPCCSRYGRFLVQSTASRPFTGRQYFSRPPTMFSSAEESRSSDYQPPRGSTVVRCQGDCPYGSREYLLIQSSGSITGEEAPLASLRAHRNVLFAASVLTPRDKEFPSSISLDVCTPLVKAALVHAGAESEQPQALATLHGLCEWVVACLKGEATSKVLRELQEQRDATTWQAVEAIATGIPRPGHSVVGAGTFRDGSEGWEALAREYAPQSKEVQLYQKEGAEVVGIELLTHTREEYLKSAGGAMARMFFL